MYVSFKLLTVLFYYFNSYECYDTDSYPLLMPDVVPKVNDIYLCTPVRVNSTKNYYVVGFNPRATMGTVHHMLLYGCLKPGNSDPVWNCGEMASSFLKEKSRAPCATGSQIIYAWARDAPKLNLPDGVGFQIGGKSPIQYLVLQVHYSNVEPFMDGTSDNSGVYLQYTTSPLSKLAGVLLLGTSGAIPPHRIEHMECACTVKEDKILHPFAFRTHTHKLGKVVSGYRVRNGSYGHDWTLIGKRDPMEPEMFYPVDNPDVTIQKGDVLASRCTMRSNRKDYTYVGPTNTDEMCNFYLMYWVEGTPPLDEKYCFTDGPPNYYWNTLGGLTNIPKDASSLNSFDF